MSTAIASPPRADVALDEPSSGNFAQAQSVGLWQTAVLAIARRVAAAVGNTDQLASDAASALAESLHFDFCGLAGPLAMGEFSIALNAVKFGVDVPAEPLAIADRPEDSLIAFALASGRLVATPDIGQETRYHDAVLRRCQAQSAVACPLRSNGVNYGGILLASLAPRAISANDIACIETISHLVGAALARSRTEQLLDQSQQSVEALEALDASVVMLDADLRLLQINRNCTDLTGFLPCDLERRAFCSALLAPEDEAAVNRVFQQLLSDGQPRQFEARLLRKHGDERRVEWRFRRLEGKRSGILLGTGIDVTEKHELEGRFAKLQQAMAAPSQTPKDENVATAGEPQMPARSAEQRRVPRRPYPYVQRMAPIREGQMPGLGEFGEVQCRDISAGGFSYYAEAKPTETEIVIAFGVDGMETFMVARILHVRPAVRNGKQLFVVGCQYTGRRHYT